MPTSLSIVRRYFPDVEKVVDGTKSITVHITPADSKRATKKNHSACALAVACRDQEDADGVIVAINTVYVIKGTRAFRYKNLESTSREIVSFDREAGFEPGDYRLRPPFEGEKLGRDPRGKKHGKDDGNNKRKAPQHITTNIRTSLNSGGAQ